MESRDQNQLVSPKQQTSPWGYIQKSKNQINAKHKQHEHQGLDEILKN